MDDSTNNTESKPDPLELWKLHEASGPGAVVAARISDARLFGWDGAVLIQQVRFFTSDREWWKATLDDLAAACGFAVSKARRWTAKLAELGVLVRERRQAHWGDQTYSYRLRGPEDDSPRGEEGSDVEEEDQTTNRANCANAEPRDLNTCTSPLGEEDMNNQLALFGDPEPEPAKRMDETTLKAAFESFWERWPTKKGRRTAFRAFTKAMTDGGSAVELLERLTHYLDARHILTQRFQVDPPEMAASTFIAGKHEEWAQAWPPERVESYWWNYLVSKGRVTPARRRHSPTAAVASVTDIVSQLGRYPSLAELRTYLGRQPTIDDATELAQLAAS